MPIDTPRALEVLRDGEIEIVGRLMGSSNHAMLCRVRLACPEPGETDVVEAVYKPTAGERPLDDFPDETLSHREVAAFLVSEAIGWSIVPPTIRRDGPFGDGVAPALDRRRSRRRRRRDGRRGRPPAPPDRGLRRGGEQHGPEGRPPPAGFGRPRLRRGPRRHVLDRARSSGRCSGAGAAGRSRPTSGRRWPGSPTRSAATSPGDLASLLSRAEIAATRRRVDGLLETGAVPAPAPGLAGDPVAAVLSRMARPRR